MNNYITWYTISSAVSSLTTARMKALAIMPLYNNMQNVARSDAFGFPAGRQPRVNQIAFTTWPTALQAAHYMHTPRAALSFTLHSQA